MKLSKIAILCALFCQSPVDASMCTKELKKVVDAFASGIAFSPVTPANTQFKAVVDRDRNVVEIYAVDRTTGALAEVAGSPFATGAAPNEAVFSDVSQGRLFLAVTNTADDTVSFYDVNTTTGTLLLIQTIPANNQSLKQILNKICAAEVKQRSEETRTGKKAAKMLKRR